MSMYWYGKGLVHAFTELEAGGAAKTPTIMLLSDAHVYDPEDEFIADISANEAAGTGYSAGGEVWDNLVYAFDSTTGLFTITGDDWLPPSLAVTCRYAVPYLDTGTPATSPLLGCGDLTDEDGDEIEVTGLAMHPAGVLVVSVALP